MRPSKGNTSLEHPAWALGEDGSALGTCPTEDQPLDGIQKLKSRENRSPLYVCSFGFQIFMELVI